jgi:hypothetical protein
MEGGFGMRRRQLCQIVFHLRRSNTSRFQPFFLLLLSLLVLLFLLLLSELFRFCGWPQRGGFSRESNQGTSNLGKFSLFPFGWLFFLIYY